MCAENYTLTYWECFEILRSNSNTVHMSIEPCAYQKYFKTFVCVNIKQTECCAKPESILFSYRMKGLLLLEVQCLWSWSLVSILQLQVVEWRALNILILGGTFYLVSNHTITVYRSLNNTSSASLVKQLLN